ncbi:TrkA family potassium uptake protein [Clostridiales bacterium COT073_COT-073]|nr:TrkA family potassium uptake protein [Clostridiales bacterium COT073_COT-073]
MSKNQKFTGEKKEFVVFGLGRFGRSVAYSLAAEGYDVLAVDIDPDLVQDASEIVAHAVIADITDMEALEELGLGNFDVAIVAMSNNLQASILATILAKEKGVPYIIANAKDAIHEKVLLKVGADKVIFPEKEIGEKIANNLINKTFMDFIELSTDFCIAEVEVLNSWVGQSLRKLNLREKHKLNAIGIKHNGETSIMLDPDALLKEGEILILIGTYDSFKEIGH